jgi:hypothetical protein
VRYYVHERDYMQASKSFQTIYDAIVKSDLKTSDRKTAFQNYLIFLLIATHSAEKVNLLAKAEVTYARELE